MYQVTNPKTGKKYTYSTARKADAEGLAKKLGVEVVEVIAVGSLPNRRPKVYTAKMCLCGRREDTHESYDCYKDDKLTNG
jgi:hypothetical protein